jgi:hypothetical protein
MSISIDERYKQAFEAHRHASDFRGKIVAGWAASYAAVAGAFVWMQANHMSLTWVVTATATAITALMWIADLRNRAAIRRSKDVGASIENDPAAGVPLDQRFFAGLDKGISHSSAINGFAVVAMLVLVVATVCLWRSAGVLPS